MRERPQGRFVPSLLRIPFARKLAPNVNCTPLLGVLDAGCTRVGATATATMLDDFRARYPERARVSVSALTSARRMCARA